MAFGALALVPGGHRAAVVVLAASGVLLLAMAVWLRWPTTEVSAVVLGAGALVALPTHGSGPLLVVPLALLFWGALDRAYAALDREPRWASGGIAIAGMGSSLLRLLVVVIGGAASLGVVLVGRSVGRGPALLAAGVAAALVTVVLLAFGAGRHLGRDGASSDDYLPPV